MCLLYFSFLFFFTVFFFAPFLCLCCRCAIILIFIYLTDYIWNKLKWTLRKQRPSTTEWNYMMKEENPYPYICGMSLHFIENDEKLNSSSKTSFVFCFFFSFHFSTSVSIFDLVLPENLKGLVHYHCHENLMCVNFLFGFFSFLLIFSVVVVVAVVYVRKARTIQKSHTSLASGSRYI